MDDNSTSAVRLRRKDPNDESTPNGILDHNDTPKHARNPSTSITTNILSTYIPTLTLIFTGCCSNVYTLESLISASPTSGPLLTFAQFLLVSLFSSSSCLKLSSSPPFIHLKPRSIPITKWIIYTIMFVTINLLNNIAFGYRISVPLHIILRSAGPVTSMGVAYIFNNARYPRLKIIAVSLLFLGVVLAALSDSYARSTHHTNLTTTTTSSYPTPSKLTILRQQSPGFLLLFLALLLSAFLGLYTDKLYTAHGRDPQATAESLFYSHTLSLPFFALQSQALTTSFLTLTRTSLPLSTTLAFAPPPPSSPLTSKNVLNLTLNPFSILHALLSSIPTALLTLFLNAFTQYLCISGVNRLAAKSSSLTVSIVLNIRKLVSLLLSIWLFGNKLPLGVGIGAMLVFLGGGLYAWPTSSNRKGRKKKGLGVEKGMADEGRKGDALLDSKEGKKEL